MCKHGQEALCWVPIKAEDSYTGEMRWAQKAVDACLVEQVKALNREGRWTRTCCCGHGECQGAIILHDGTVIPVEGKEV